MAKKKTVKKTATKAAKKTAKKSAGKKVTKSPAKKVTKKTKKKATKKTTSKSTKQMGPDTTDLKVEKKKVAKKTAKKATKAKVEKTLASDSTKKVQKEGVKVTKKTKKEVESKNIKKKESKDQIEASPEESKNKDMTSTVTTNKKATKKEAKDKADEGPLDAAVQDRVKELEERIVDEVETLREDYNLVEIQEAIRDVDFFKANNESDECLEKFCENLQTTLGYCRYHYIRNWKGIKKKQQILKEGKLQMFVEELISKYPTKYLENIMSDLSGDRAFFKVLRDLNIDSNYNFDDITSDGEGDDDITVDTRGYGKGRGSNYDDEEVL